MPAKKNIAKKPAEETDKATNATAQPAPTISQEQKPEKKVKYAGVLVRIVASLIDEIIILILIFIFLIILAAVGIAIDSENPLLTLLGLLFVAIYYVFSDVKFGATIGKNIFGLRVVDENLSTPLSWKKAVMRELVGRVIVDSITAKLGDFLILVDVKKQTLHDKIANTYVVHEKDSEITVKV